ncbi:type II toxin-antitoxin system HicA family toxin [bacterium]|nr:type II toxin-antitoxin system HicA family toxin [bacterium]
MPRLPRISGRKARAVFERAGYRHVRTQGSHFILRHPQTGQHLSVPDHDLLKPGLLSALVKRADMTVEEFIASL